MLRVGVGYPDRWRDHRGLEIVPGDAFGNAERARAAFGVQAGEALYLAPADRVRMW